MKTEMSDHGIRMWLTAFGLAAWVGVPALGQDGVYAARVSSSSTTVWDAPFYWIDTGAYSQYGPSDKQSTAAGTPMRIGSYYHTAYNLPVGEGYGLVHSKGTNTGAVYEVQVTQPSYLLVTDIIMNVGSTNCDIGGVFGATDAGGWTNTTAFQAAYAANQWARVCYLTNWPGVTQPHVDFKYVSGGSSGGSGSDRTFADCVRFHLIGSGTNSPTPVRISSFAGTTLEYSGGSGTRFVLLQCANLTGWQRVTTNFVTPGSFAVPPIGTQAATFYAIASE